MARQLILGYEPIAPELQSLGGGLVTMIQPALIVMSSSTYAGLFEETGLLDGLKTVLGRMAAKLGRESALAVSALSICSLCCNQTLSSILTQQLFQEQYGEDNQALALDIEDATIVLCGLVPWCIACSVPLVVVNAPMLTIVTACYLILQPICMVVRAKMTR